jgi:shikimate kinase
VTPRAVLVGPPGAGKSTVGPLLAERLGVDFRDCDDDIEAVAGKSVADIFVDDGEPHFRALERAAVARALEAFDGVLALGGGAILAAETRSRLNGHRVVYLAVDLSTAVRRVGLGIGRPLLTVNPRATLKYLLDQRRPLYEAVASYTVDTSRLAPAGGATVVLPHLLGGGAPPHEVL